MGMKSPALAMTAVKPRAFRDAVLPPVNNMFQYGAAAIEACYAITCTQYIHIEHQSCIPLNLQGLTTALAIDCGTKSTFKHINACDAAFAACCKFA